VRTSFNWAQLARLWPKAYASAALLHDQNSAVLNQLRELRATLAGHTARLERVEEHVDRIDGQLRDIHLLIARALERDAAGRLGAGNPEDARSEESATPQRSVDRRQQGRPQDRPVDRLEERVTDVERRLAMVEERLEG
jgi:archaellum component FlaC